MTTSMGWMLPQQTKCNRHETKRLTISKLATPQPGQYIDPSCHLRQLSCPGLLPGRFSPGAALGGPTPTTASPIAPPSTSGRGLRPLGRRGHRRRNASPPPCRRHGAPSLAAPLAQSSALRRRSCPRRRPAAVARSTPACAGRATAGTATAAAHTPPSRSNFGGCRRRSNDGLLSAARRCWCGCRC